MRDYHGLKVWHKAHELALSVYRATEAFPRAEVYGLTSQLRRAAVSAPTNIAEGCGRTTEVELARFLEIAAGSASEVDYLLFLARDLHYLDEAGYQTLQSQADEVKRMLGSFIRTVRTAGEER